MKNYTLTGLAALLLSISSSLSSCYPRGSETLFDKVKQPPITQEAETKKGKIAIKPKGYNVNYSVCFFPPARDFKVKTTTFQEVKTYLEKNRFSGIQGNNNLGISEKKYGILTADCSPVYLFTEGILTSIVEFEDPGPIRTTIHTAKNLNNGEIKIFLYSPSFEISKKKAIVALDYPTLKLTYYDSIEPLAEKHSGLKDPIFIGNSIGAKSEETKFYGEKTGFILFSARSESGQPWKTVYAMHLEKSGDLSFSLLELMCSSKEYDEWLKR